MKLTDKNYVERDASWMHFNKRILDEAQRPDLPVLERLNFLGIYSNNLDEFFRVRVATLNHLVEYADKSTKELSDRSEQALKTIKKLNAQYVKIFEETVKDVTEELNRHNIHLLSETDLDKSQQEFIKQYCITQLSGAISPIWLSSIKTLTASDDDTLFLAIRLQRWHDHKKKPEKDYAIIELPVKQFGRFVVLPDTTEQAEPLQITEEGVVTNQTTTHHNVMYLDDVVRCALPYMFAGISYNQFEAWSFKFTKDAEMEIESDIRGGTLQKIAKGVKSRKNGLPVRMIMDASMPKEMIKRLLQHMNLTSVDTMITSGRYQNHKDFMKFPHFASPANAPLEFPRWSSVMPQWAQPQEGQPNNLLKVIREEDRFLHVPYQTFDAYINVLREAAINPEVKGIKTTLYRLAKDSKVIGALIAAARNGKKVTVVIELLARFDEESNIDWSKKMADAGINVITGVEGLKIHSKVTHISARGGDVAIISTGNFHEGNARAYTDFMMFTSLRPIVTEVSRVFDFIERPYLPTRFKELMVSPNDMRNKLGALINQEIKNHNMGRPARILCKLNHVTDEAMVKRIYEAAEAGVKVDLLVRGNCSLVPNIPELGGNLRVNAIIDRYLEHSRILIFANGTDLDAPETANNTDDSKVFIGSADWMPRNLDHRIEVYTPVYAPELKKEARLIVEYGMRNKRNEFRSQEELYNHYQS